MIRWKRQIGLLGPLVLWWWMAACGSPTGTCQQDSECSGGQKCLDKLCRCPDASARCGNTCVSLLDDNAHCGACNHACPQGSACSSGRCLCPSSRVSCANACVDLQSDPKHCGNCGASCKSGEKCATGRCVVNCPTLTPDACGDACVSLQTDVNHCGACSKACTAGQTCQNGQCFCPAGQRDCGGACVDVVLSPKHCGACNNACPSGQSCAIGECVQQCPASTPTLCLGSCVDLARDAAHCGACGSACPTGQRCQEGRCTCPDGSTLCAGRCVELQSSGQHCGVCDNPCASGSVCAEGLCIPSCPSATSASCFGGCVSTQTNAAHCGGCGKACKEGEVCNNGSCACPSGLLSCDGSCLDPKVNRLHCGACNSLCKAGEVCANGSCVQSCPAVTNTACYGGCFDIQQDARHCGKCGIACRAGFICKAGVCTCPNEQASCLGRCTDLQTNSQHCGACGKRCASTESCDKGQCVLRCAPPTQACNSACVDTKTDSQHCGSCGNGCTNTQQCKDGSCVCREGRADCGDGRCIDTLYNAQHCGACNNACAGGKICDQGKCICHPDGCPLVIQGIGTDRKNDGGRFTNLLIGKNQELIYALSYRGNVNLAGKAFKGSNTSSLGLIAIKPDGSGHEWAVEVAGVSEPNNPDGIRVTSMQMDNNGALYVFGTFAKSITLGNATYTPPQGQFPTRHGFVAKLNAQQQWESVKILNLSEIPGVNDIYIETFALARASTGEIYLSGIFKGKLTFSPLSPLGPLSIESSTRQLFVIQLGSDLSEKSATQSTDAPDISRVNLAIDSTDRLYLSTSFTDSIKLGGQLLSGSTSGETIRAVAHLDFGKTPLPWRWSSLAPTGDDDERGILAAPNGGLLVSATLRDAFQLGSTNLPKPPHPTALLASFDPQGQIRWTQTFTSNNQSGGSLLYASPSGNPLWVITHFDAGQIGGLSALPPQLGEQIAASIFSFDPLGKALTASTLTTVQSIRTGFEGSPLAMQIKEKSLFLAGSLRQGTSIYGQSYNVTGIEDPFAYRLFFQ